MKYYVVKDGKVLFSGTKKECVEIIENDMSGELEIYSETGRI